MKSSFALLLTIMIVALFSLVISQMSLTKSLNSNHQTNAYVYTQAQFHLDFFKELILDMENLECQNHLVLPNTAFDIHATLTYASTQNNCTHTNAIVDVFVKSKSSHIDIGLHERFVKKL
jgi:hypothetical protein